MKGVKQCGLLLALFITLGLSFVISSDVNALKHEYLGIPYDAVTIPAPRYDSNTNTKYFDFSNGSSLTFYGSNLILEWKGDAYNSNYDNLSVKYSASRLPPYPSGNQCQYADIKPIFQFGDNRVSTYLGTPYSSLFSSSVLSQHCNVHDHKFGDSVVPSFNNDSIPLGLLQCNTSNGAVCGGLWNTKEYVSSQILPYSYSSDGFYLKSKAINSNGIQYNNTFSFSDMFNSYIPTFSYLSIPLHDYGGYFMDPDNLYSGRQMEIKGTFEFDGNFEWHDNIQNNGSFFRIYFQGMKLHGSDSNWVDKYYDCSTNLIEVAADGLTRLEYSCPFTLDTDYILMSGLELQISGNDNYVWKTDDTWRFTTLFLVTDDDETSGSSFNETLSGGGTFVGDAKNNFPSDNPFAVIIDGADFSGSLMNLFGFTFINPFAGIFNLFMDQNSCANIPIIAGMIHSQETQVCPWFSSSTRNIVTPVLGLASVMLVFGFAVHWLGARSGNMFEDSVQTDNYSFRSRVGGRKK